MKSIDKLINRSPSDSMSWCDFRAINYKFFKDINSYKQLPEIMLNKITHFFENYKKLEQGKWVKINNWQDADRAKQIIIQALERNKL